MKALDNINEELRTLAPTLSKLEKSKYESVPEGYFDKMHAQLMHKVRQDEIFNRNRKTETESKPHWIEALINWVKPAYSMPALAVLIILVITFSIYKNEQVDNNITLTELTDEEIQIYLAENASLVNDLYEETLILSEIDSDLSEEELNSYLLDNADELNLNEWL